MYRSLQLHLFNRPFEKPWEVVIAEIRNLVEWNEILVSQSVSQSISQSIDQSVSQSVSSQLAVSR